MSSRYSTIISIFLSVLCAYLIYAFVEYYEEEQDLGWGKEARKNPFLAAQLYSESRGHVIQSYDSFLKIPSLDEIDTLFIANTGQVISDKRLDALSRWVDRGGHLLIGAKGVIEADSDRVFEYYDLSSAASDHDGGAFGEDFFDDLKAPEEESASLQPDEESDISTEDEESEQVVGGDSNKNKRKFSDELRKLNDELRKQGLIENASGEEKSYRQTVADYEAAVAVKEMSLLRFGSDEYDIRVQFNPEIILQHGVFDDGEWYSEKFEPIYWRGSEYGIHFLQLEQGDGLVTVMSDSNVFRSDNIDKFDHALFWQVLTGSGSIAILYGSNMPSLWYMLKAFMPEILLSFAAFIVAWIWFNIRRFGPVRPLSINQRRSAAEHISASAGYTWRGGWQGDLLAPLRDDVQQFAEKRLASYDELNDRKRMDILAQVSGLHVDVVIDAMTTKKKLNEENFYRIVKILKRIRESL